MLRLALFLAVLLAAPVAAQDLPALYRVTGVAANDMLNVRAAPSARAAILSGFGPGAGGIEVVALAEGGRWGQVNLGESIGWVSMRFLTREGDAGWRSGTVPMQCFGTEPFWSVSFFLPGHRAEFHTPDNGGVELVTDAGALPATVFPPTLAIPFSGAHDGMAVIRPATCSDGMSDGQWGLETQVYFRGDTNGLSGCCTLAR